MKKLNICAMVFALTTFSAFAQVRVLVHENDAITDKMEGALMLGTGNRNSMQATGQALYYLNALNQGPFVGSEIGTDGLSLVGGHAMQRSNGDVIAPYLQAGLANDNINLGVRYSKNINNNMRAFGDAALNVAGSGRSYVRAGVSIPVSRANRQ